MQMFSSFLYKLFLRLLVKWPISIQICAILREIEKPYFLLGNAWMRENKNKSAQLCDWLTPGGGALHISPIPAWNKK